MLQNEHCLSIKSFSVATGKDIWPCLLHNTVTKQKNISTKEPLWISSSAALFFLNQIDTSL